MVTAMKATPRQDRRYSRECGNGVTQPVPGSSLSVLVKDGQSVALFDASYPPIEILGLLRSGYDMQGEKIDLEWILRRGEPHCETCGRMAVGWSNKVSACKIRV